MSDAMRTMKNRPEDSTLSQATSSAAESVRGVATQASETVREAASTVAREGKQAASYIGNKAEDAAGAVGGRLKAAGESLRSHGPHDGALGQASSAVARTLEETGVYLQEEGFSGMGCDIANMVKRNPIPSLLLGIGLGYLIANATSSRR